MRATLALNGLNKFELRGFSPVQNSFLFPVNISEYQRFSGVFIEHRKGTSPLTFTFSKSTIETLGKSMKYVQS